MAKKNSSFQPVNPFRNIGTLLAWEEERIPSRSAEHDMFDPSPSGERPMIRTSRPTPTMDRPTDVQELRVLVIEDEPSVRDIISDLLQFCGHEVETAINGEEGVEKYLQFRPDLVIMDVSMPLMNGYDASRRINELDAQATILLITGVPDAMLARRALDEELASNLIYKPFRFDQLQTAIEDTLKWSRSPSHISSEGTQANPPQDSRPQKHSRLVF
jgi:CheY-like chemotaxis protein